jgi:hypothetical protein
MDERFVVRRETNGVRQVGYILMSRTEATRHLEADRTGHESDGWDVAVCLDRSSIVMTKTSVHTARLARATGSAHGGPK